MIKKGDLKKDIIEHRDIENVKKLLDQFYLEYSNSDYSSALGTLSKIIKELWLMNSITYLKKPENKISF